MDDKMMYISNDNKEFSLCGLNLLFDQLLLCWTEPANRVWFKVPKILNLKPTIERTERNGLEVVLERKI